MIGSKLDKAGCYTNRTYLIDFIKLTILVRALDPAILREIYLQNGATASQLAAQFGVSKQSILVRLRQSGVMRSEGRGRSAINYRYPNPPYGYRVCEERLVINRAEAKVVRIIIELRERKKLSWEEIARSLNDNGLRTRRGAQWARTGIQRIHRRWNGKI